MWVASFSDLSLSVRQVLKMERVNSWRNLGKLEKGLHYLTLEEAKEACIEVGGFNSRGAHSQRYAYNVESLIELFKDKHYVTRKPK